MRFKNANYEKDGGFLVYYDSAGENTTYFRLTGYQEKATEFNYIGRQGNVWCKEHSGGKNCTMLCINPAGLSGDKRGYSVSGGWYSTDAHNVRCIQEEE